jgi:serine protease AprX
MPNLKPFKLEPRALAREMRMLVEQLGKGTIAGDYHNPLGVRVDPLFVIHEAELEEDAAKARVTRVQLSGEDYVVKDFEREKRLEERRPRASGKISSGLRDLMQRARRGEIFEVVVTLAVDDGVHIPLLPDLEEDERREERIAEVERVIAALQARRSRGQRTFLEKMQLSETRKILEHFWITNSFAVELSRAEIQRLARDESVAYLQPVFGGESPPQDSNPNNDAIVARGHIRSDPYFNQNLTNPWIGLLDTGVRRTHTMFNNPDRIAFCMDCVNGGVNCNQTGNE